MPKTKYPIPQRHQGHVISGEVAPVLFRHYKPEEMDIMGPTPMAEGCNFSFGPVYSSSESFTKREPRGRILVRCERCDVLTSVFENWGEYRKWRKQVAQAAKEGKITTNPDGSFEIKFNRDTLTF